MGRGQAEGVLLQALDAEDLGADRLLRRGGMADDGGGELQRESPFQDTERAPSRPGRGSFGISVMNRRQAEGR
jgi:hypothetical protein